MKTDAGWSEFMCFSVPFELETVLVLTSVTLTGGSGVTHNTLCHADMTRVTLHGPRALHITRA